MPWETGATEGKYRYHPGGDGTAEPKDAPSAVNVVVIPNVDLPKVRTHVSLSSFEEATCLPAERFQDCWLTNYYINPRQQLLANSYISQRLHDKYNKWGKDGY